MTPDLPKKIVTLQACPGRTVFRVLAQPRIKWVEIEDQDPEPHQLVVLPCSSLGIGFTKSVGEIPDWVWAPARSGHGRVVIDASLEGQPHDAKRSRKLHDFLREVGVPRNRAVYLTQDRGYEAEYRERFEGRDAEPLMKVMVYDFWIRMVLDQHAQDGREVFETRLAAYRARPRRRERRFLALNRNVRASKVLFMLRLLRDGLWPRGFISVGGLQERLTVKGFAEESLEEELFREAPFADLNEGLRPLLPQLAALGRIEFSTDEPAQLRFREVMDQGLAEYGQSWFSVVTETEMRDRVLRITEKPLKALMNFHPFIVLGNPGALELLGDYGFESYRGMFDEAYDAVSDRRDRFERVYREVERLCALPEAELDRLDREVEEVVIRNAWRALVELPQLCRDQLDPDFVRQIMAPADPVPLPIPSR